MNAKKFIAATSRDALLLVRNELGADAVILSNRKVDEGVEITALASADLDRFTESKDEPIRHVSQPKSIQNILAQATATKPVPEVSPASVATPSSIVKEQQGILSEIKSMRDMMQEQIACMSWSDMQQRDPQRTQMLRNLLHAGFSPALSRQLLERMPAEADISWVRQVLANNLRVATQDEDVVVRGGVVALIGPTASVKLPQPQSWLPVQWYVMAQTKWRY